MSAATASRIIQGDCLEVLKTLESESVHCCVTSPPYFGLRDYGVDGQLGLEESPAAYVSNLVAVFAEVRRVLRADGTLWLNIGDSFASGPKNRTVEQVIANHGLKGGLRGVCAAKRQQNKIVGDLKSKDLIGIPWELAFALPADGWYLRQDIIWHKANPMPESVTDRCTKSHEYIFLLSKSARYYFNSDAISEPCVTDESENYVARAKITGRGEQGSASARGNDRDRSGGFPPKEDGEGVARRNKRSVWTIVTKPYKPAHFATFPPELILPCILAGCPPGGTVLDPFLGSGTTAVVAQRNSCHYLGIELNPAYVKLAQNRIRQKGLW